MRLEPQGPQEGDTGGSGRQISWNVLHERGCWFRADTALTRDEDNLTVSGSYLAGRRPLAFRIFAKEWGDSLPPSSPDTLSGTRVDGIWRLSAIARTPNPRTSARGSTG